MNISKIALTYLIVFGFQHKKMRSKNRKWVFQLLAITAVGTLMRIIAALNVPVTFDEAHNILLIKTDNILLMIKAAADAHPPLFHFIWHFWQMASDNLIFLRLPSLAFGIAAIIIIAFVGRKLFNGATGLLAAFLVAIAPSQIYYSSITRMYGLAIFESTLLVYFFLKILTKRQGFIPLGIIMVVGLYTHFFFIILIFLLNLYVLVQWQKNKDILRQWIKLNVIVALSYVPMIILIFTIERSFAVPTNSFLKLPVFFISPVIPWDIIQTVAVFQRLKIDLLSLFTIGLGLLSLIILVWSFLSLRKNSILSALIFVYFWAAIVILLISYFVYPIAALRSFIIFSPLFFLIISASLVKLRGKIGSVTIIFFSVIIFMFLGIYLLSDAKSKDGLKQIYSQFKTDDVVIYNDVILFLPSQVLKPNGKHFLMYPGHLPEISYQAFKVHISSFPNLPTADRIWYVKQKTNWTPYESLADQLENTLKKNYTELKRKYYYQFQLILYVSKED